MIIRAPPPPASLIQWLGRCMRLRLERSIALIPITHPYRHVEGRRSPKKTRIRTSSVEQPLLFRRLWGTRVGPALSDRAIALVIQRRAALAGLEGDFGGHSLRSGLLPSVPGRRGTARADGHDRSPLGRQRRRLLSGRRREGQSGVTTDGVSIASSKAAARRRPGTMQFRVARRPPYARPVQSATGRPHRHRMSTGLARRCLWLSLEST